MATRNGFKLLKLPFLAIEQVFLYLEILEIIDISLCSKRCKNVVKRNRATPATYINIEFSREHGVDVCSVDNKKAVATWNFSNTNMGNRKKMWWSIDGAEGYTLKNINSQNIRNGFYQCCTPSRQIAASMNTVISHLLEVLRNCYVKHVNINMHYERVAYKTLLDLLKTCESLEMISDGSSDHTKHVLSSIKITKTFNDKSYLYSSANPFLGALECTDHINCDNASWMRAETLLTLNCEYVELKKARLTAEDIMEYLKKWKNSTGMGRVRKLNIMHTAVGIGPLDFEELGAMRWDPVKRAAMYRLHDGLYIMCNNGMDIERADGLLATIVQHETRGFFFLVWADRFPDQTFPYGAILL
ncbi:hypothetical protein CRE_16188 [Caenorhabditis remanei]|uniref:F-box domain-containing protein n=1 Tax=Caenorhabditis remanei TaxID=31234 RepID=E3MSH2_CAERE|nr:hypothetical protein CRE_16188 [Caenorhabditis remanei]